MSAEVLQVKAYVARCEECRWEARGLQDWKTDAEIDAHKHDIAHHPEAAQ